MSGDEAGYNSQMFKDEAAVGRVMEYLGYMGRDGDKLLTRFQRHWNRVISRVGTSEAIRNSIPFVIVPEGNLRVDGEIGPNTLNALEVAFVNQKTSANLAWPAVIQMVGISEYGRKNLYNAAEGM